MVNDKFCVGIAGNQLKVRLDPVNYEETLRQSGCVPMDFTGHPMRGFVFVNSNGTKSEKSLHSGIQSALDYNPLAHSWKAKSKGASISAGSSATTQRKKRNSKGYSS